MKKALIRFVDSHPGRILRLGALGSVVVTIVDNHVTLPLSFAMRNAVAQALSCGGKPRPADTCTGGKSLMCINNKWTCQKGTTGGGALPPPSKKAPEIPFTLVPLLVVALTLMAVWIRRRYRSTAVYCAALALPVTAIWRHIGAVS